MITTLAVLGGITCVVVVGWLIVSLIAAWRFGRAMRGGRK